MTLKKIVKLEPNFWRGKVRSYKATLECGHEEYVKPSRAKGSHGRPEKAKCTECLRTDSATNGGDRG